MRIDPDHPALPGHFPGRPIVPGALLLAIVLGEARARLDRHAPERRIDGIRQAKFLRTLGPGQIFEVELDSPRGDTQRFRVLSAGEPIASGILALAARG